MLLKIRNNLAAKISITFAIAQIVIMLAFSAYMYVRYSKILHTEHYEMTARPAILIASRIASVDLIDDKPLLEELIGAPVHFAILVDSQGIITHATEKAWIGQPIITIDALSENARTLTEPTPPSAADGCTTVVRQVTLSSTGENATIYVETDNNHIAKRIAQVVQYALIGVIAVVIVYASFLGFAVRRSIHQPVAQLVNVLRDAEQGNLSVRTFVNKAEDDIGILQRRTNAMLSARERAHSDIEHLNRVLRTIRDVNQIIAQHHDNVPLVEAVIDHLTSSGCYDCAWIALFDPAGTIKRISMFMTKGNDPVIDADELGTAECIQRIAFQEQEVIVITPDNHASKQCSCALIDRYTQSMTVKLDYGQTVYGIISVAVPDEYTIDIQEKTLFHAIADDIAYGLHNVQNDKERVLAQRNLDDTRQQWQRVVDTMPVMLDAFDSDGHLIAWNQQAERVSGYSAEEIIGNPKAAELLYPDPAYRSQVQDSVNNPTSEFGLHHEWVLTTKDGKERIVDWFNGSQYAPLPMWHHWAVGIDITERVQAERALRQTNQHIESLLQNPIGYAIFRLALADPFEDTIVILVSPSAEAITGVPAESGTLLVSWLQYIHPDDLDNFGINYRKGLAPPYTFDMELRYRHPKLGLRWLHVRATTVLDPGNGTPTFSNGILIDITERVETARALRESNRHIESMLQNSVGYVMFRLKMGSTPQECKLILVSPSVGDVAGVVPCEQDSITTWLRFVHPEDAPHLMQAFAQGMQAPYVVDIEVRYMHPRNGLRWLHIQANGVLDDNIGVLEYANGMLMDITERKHAESQLQETLERLSQAEVAAQSGFWANNPETNQEWWSINHYRLHGLEPADHPTPTFDLHTSRIHPDDRANFIYKRQRDLANAITHTEYEFRLVMPDGTPRDVRTRAQIERDEHGHAVRVMGMDQDITERKANEKRLADLLDQVQQQAHQMHQVINTVPDGLALLDHQLYIQIANPAATAILHDVCGLEPGDRVEQIGDIPIAQLLKPPETPGTWHEVQYKNRTYEILARLVNAQSQHRAWVLAMRDVTAERLAQHYTEQQERLASVGQLAAGIAHDFNNIMAVIILYAGSLLITQDLADSSRERLQTIADQARAATSLIQQILDFSRRSNLERRPMDLVPFFKEQRLLFQRTLPENIDVQFNYGRSDYIVDADPTSLQQVMMNLAVNARDAMPDGGTLTITLSISHTPHLQSVRATTNTLQQWVCITVQDTGQGMPNEVMEHLFEPFHTTKDPGKGSGLGLAQVHGIVGQHDGEITVESIPDMGTTFRIYLALLDVAQTHQISEPEDNDLAVGTGETILVVEDNAIMRASLVESLHLLNYKSLEAANGHEALFILSRRSEEIDMVLSDVVMPSMGGIDLFHAIREQSLNVPMALLTGHPLRNELEGLLDQGLRAWMTKPPSLDGLAQMLRKVLGDPDYA